MHGNAWLCGFSPSATVDIGGVNSTDTTFGTACGDVDALRALDQAWASPASAWGAPDPCGRNSGTRWGGLLCSTDFSRVSGLELRNVSLAGAIPAAVWNLTALARLALANASLTGELSSSGLGALTNLSSLALGWNALDGVLPTSLWGLTMLTSLSLPSNALSGPLPPGVGLLTLLSDLDLSVNALSEALPTQLGSLAALTLLSLGTNHFVGSLPSEVGALANLARLSVASNGLGGALPSQLGSCTKLVSLAAAANAFNGSLPASLGGLTSLASLLLSFNALSGGVPAGLTALTTLEVHGNAWLCGFPPANASGISLASVNATGAFRSLALSLPP